MVRERQIEVMHGELQNWKSYLEFIGDEMIFIQRLLDSYIFEPKTPNWFEQLETYRKFFNTAKKNRRSLLQSIKRHENRLGGIFESTQEECDHHYYQRHQDLKGNIADYIKNYIDLKKEIYKYAGAVLKMNKPLY